VTADPQQLRRAIANLLDNAISATPQGGRILVELGKSRGETKIVISDNGRGMNQHELARALEGIRMAADGKGIERRHGLGIPLARQLIEAHDGKLEIVSRPSSGTTATITLP
jgi:signal transduction histidine kinase